MAATAPQSGTQSRRNQSATRRSQAANTRSRELQERRRRACALLEREVRYIDSPDFRKRSFQRAHAQPLGIDLELRDNVPAGLSGYMADLYRTRLLTSEEEVFLFQRMNYLLYQAEKQRRRIDLRNPDRATLKDFEILLAGSRRVRNLIIRANLRLVVSIVKKFVASSNPAETYDELISDGHEALLQAVERFDYSRGYRLSTYASHAIYRNVSRALQSRSRRRKRETTSLDDEGGNLFASLEDDRDAHRAADGDRSRAVQRLDSLIGQLPPREQTIIRARFGLEADPRQPLTLQAIANEQGVCKERVRQLVNRALNQLRAFAATAGFQEPEFLRFAAETSDETASSPRPR